MYLYRVLWSVKVIVAFAFDFDAGQYRVVFVSGLSRPTRHASNFGPLPFPFDGDRSLFALRGMTAPPQAASLQSAFRVD